jgi:chemotaxis signal transduction protein
MVEIGLRRLGVEALQVREVALAQSVTPVPMAPAPIVGVTQLRGQILPVLDLEPARAPRPSDPLLVLESGAARAALRVDRVLGVEVDDGGEKLDVAKLLGLRP